MPGPCPALPVKLPDWIWKMSKAYSSLYVSTFSVSWISHLQNRYMPLKAIEIITRTDLGSPCQLPALAMSAP